MKPVVPVADLPRVAIRLMHDAQKAGMTFVLHKGCVCVLDPLPGQGYVDTETFARTPLGRACQRRYREIGQVLLYWHAQEPPPKDRWC